MNTTKIGTEFENRVYKLFSSLLSEDELASAPQKHSKIFQHRKYQCLGLNRKIDFDITIETTNPAATDTWSSLVVIECKCYTHTVDIADLDEFENKMKKVSSSGIKGIMVTTKGFSANSLEQAKKSHIALMVLSENKHKWLVSRNINKKEQQMQILLGKEKVGLVPTIYYNDTFVPLYDYLRKQKVATTDQYVITLPWLGKEEIKEITHNIFQKTKFTTKDIAGELLCKVYPNYRITFDDLPEGILGCLSYHKNLITLSNSIISNEHRRNFTIAHELGHLYLHSEILKKYEDDTFEYEQNAILIHDDIIKNMEIQANLFASYLLMPNSAFMNIVSKLFQEYRITTRRLYLDNQPCNIRDVNFIVSKLSQEFNVSKEAVKNRLNSEGLLIYGNYSAQRIDRIIIP